MRVLPVLVICFVMLIGCGGSSNNSESSDPVLVLGERYDEKPGDHFTESSTMNVTYSNGHNAVINSIYESVYSQVNEIPTKYNYSNTDTGPYLLEMEYDDGLLDGLNYNTLSGNSIINDDLDCFTNIDHMIRNGSDEPENYYLDEKYSFYENATLFDSNSGAEVGYEITNVELSVLSEEQVTVPAGVFNAVKIEFSLSSTTSENGILDTFTSTGNGWFDTTNGFMLKMVLDVNMTLNEHGLTASGHSESVLQNYSLSSATNLNKKISNNRINKNSFLFAIKKEILNFQQRI